MFALVNGPCCEHLSTVTLEVPQSACLITGLPLPLPHSVPIITILHFDDLSIHLVWAASPAHHHLSQSHYKSAWPSPEFQLNNISVRQTDIMKLDLWNWSMNDPNLLNANTSNNPGFVLSIFHFFALFPHTTPFSFLAILHSCILDTHVYCSSLQHWVSWPLTQMMGTCHCVPECKAIIRALKLMETE